MSSRSELALAGRSAEEDGRIRAAGKTGIRLIAFALAALIPALAALGAEPGPVIRELRFVYVDPQTGDETPVDIPSPQWFAGQTRLNVGGRYSEAVANEDLARFITKQRMLCREIRTEDVAEGVRVVFVFERQQKVWGIQIVAAPGAPSIERTTLMERAVKLRQETPISRAAVDTDRWAIVAFLRRDGYHFATVNASVKPVPNRAGYSNVTFEVDRGPKVQPAAILFTGHRAQTRKQLLKLMRTREDGWFSSRRFVQSNYEIDVDNIRRRYLAEGWEDVKVEPKPVLFDAERMKVAVRYAERDDGKTFVTSLRIWAGDTVGSRTLRRQFKCRKGREFTRAKFDADLRLVTALYYEAGFRAEPDDIKFEETARGRGKGEISFEILFGRARELVVLDVSVRRAPGAGAAAAVVDKVDCRATGPYGNDHVAGLLQRLQPGSAFSEEALLEDMAAIAQLYTGPGEMSHALVDARYKPRPAGYRVFMEFIRKGPGTEPVAATIRIDINEGGRYFVESLSFVGVTAKAYADKQLFEDHLRDRLRMKKGSLFTRADLAADLGALRTAYQEKGHADVQVRLDEAHMIEPGQKVYHLRYVITEGPVFVIDIIRTRGNDKTRADVVTREMAIKPGDRFDIRKIQESERRLGNTGYFTGATVRPAPSRRPAEDGRRFKELHVHVDEGSTRRLMIGVGASSSAGVFGDIRYQDQNFDLDDPAKSWGDFVSGTAFSGGGQMLSIFLRPGTDITQFGFQWREPWLDGRPIELGVSGGFSSHDWDDYTVEKLGGSVSVGKRFRPSVTGFVGVRVHLVEVSDVSRAAATEIWDDKGTDTVIGIFAGVAQNTIDNKALPTEGGKWKATTEVVGTPGFEIVKLMVESRWYTPIHEAPDKSRHVFSLWGNAGTMLGSDPPIYEKFFAGGLGSVRGFQSHGISPVGSRRYVAPPGGAKVPDTSEDQIGGKFKIEGGAEYIFPITKRTARGVIFIDVGSIAEESFGVGDALGDLRISTGVGVQFVIPALGNAPIALYVGVPIKKEDDDETEAVTFSIGLFLP